MVFLAPLAFMAVTAQSRFGWPETVAERSDYTKTSSYADVISFLDHLQGRGAPIRIMTIGKSTLGKDIPLVICHQNPNISPAQAKSQRLPIVYIQANIHAGEVEGKEAVLRLLRELAQNPDDPILKKTVLVVQPIYNSDGNDKWGTNERNRAHQDGPDPVGERANGQGFDLNRDCIKAASPEMNAVLRHVYATWDPEVIMDLHTTNGTRHGYVLTYSPGLNPLCDPGIMKFTRDKLLPKMRKEAKQQKGWNFFDYGDASQREGKWTFSTFACDPRYVTNYASVRNRIAILSEAASFQPFKLRVESTHWFVRSLLEEIATQGDRICRLVREADERTVSRARTSQTLLGVRYGFETRGTEPIILEVDRPAAEINRRKAPTEFRTIAMTVVDRFTPTKSSRMPMAYGFTGQSKLLSLLLRHGIIVEQLLRPLTAPADFFQITKVDVATNAFQGVRLASLEGSFTPGEVSLRPGDYIVKMDQPLANLAFSILEPESLDGGLSWGFIEPMVVVGSPFPIVKMTSSFQASTRQVAVTWP